MPLFNDTMHLKCQNIFTLFSRCMPFGYFYSYHYLSSISKKIITKVKISHFSPFYHRNYFRKLSALAG